MKNFVVITQPIKDQTKGLTNYLSYLVSTKHKNHRDKTRIVPIHSTIKKLLNHCIGQITQRNLERKKAKKGGRDICSYAQSFVFSLPPDIYLNDEQWKQVAMSVFCDLANYLNLPKTTLSKSCFINLHDQDNQHINLVISKVINGKVCKDIQKKAVLALLKQSFNSAVLKTVNINHLTYKTKTSRAKRYTNSFYQENKEIINALDTNNYETEPLKVSGVAEQPYLKRDHKQTYTRTYQ